MGFDSVPNVAQSTSRKASSTGINVNLISTSVHSIQHCFLEKVTNKANQIVDGLHQVVVSWHNTEQTFDQQPELITSSLRHSFDVYTCENGPRVFMDAVCKPPYRSQKQDADQDNAVVVHQRRITDDGHTVCFEWY